MNRLCIAGSRLSKGGHQAHLYTLVKFLFSRCRLLVYDSWTLYERLKEEKKDRVNFNDIKTHSEDSSILLKRLPSSRKIIMNIIYYLCKIFRILWLAPIPRSIRHNQPALTKFGTCKQYTIDSIETRLIDGIFDWKRSLLGNRPSIKKQTPFTAIRRRNIAKCLTKTEWMLSTFWGVSATKNFVSFLKLSQKIGQSFQESLRGDTLVENFKIFWINNKTIIEFGFRVMWRIMQISEDVILHPSQPHSIFAKYI